VNAWAHLQLGSLLTQLGRIEEATAAYDDAAARFAALGCVDGPAVLRSLRMPQRAR
jgi:hypothetical protein